MRIAFPYGIDAQGRTALASAAAHIRELMEQILFTSLGERVNRPDFGAGLNRLLFEPNADALAAAAQVLVHGSLQEHLGHLIAVDAVDVEASGAALRVTIRYTGLSTGQTADVQFTGSLP